MSASEEVDVVDADDHVIGTATRAQVRSANLRHRAAYILVFNSRGQLLVHQRTANKDVYPSYFDFAVGGVVGAGEDYLTAARRELVEEIGARSVDLRRVDDLRYADDSNQVNGRIYECRYDGPLYLQPEEIVAAEWLDLDEALERTERAPFCPDGVVALERYLARPKS
jgi:isopentenyldiphosphate isomerase